MKESKSKTILIVEDDNVARRAIGRLLRVEGWTTMEAANGVQGLRIFRNQAPEIVLTDVVMPGLDGFFLTAVIKSISPDSAVIIMTGLGDTELDGKAQALGVNAFLRKPFEPDALLLSLSQLDGSSNGEKR